MKKLSTIAVVLLSVIALPAIQTVRAATQTFEGTVTDSMCKNTHMMQGVSPAKCIEECVKAGAKYALVSGSKTYILVAKTETLQSYAGKQVKVVGELKGDTITVTSIH